MCLPQYFYLPLCIVYCTVYERTYIHLSLMYCISFPQYIYLSLCISVYLFVYISLWPSIFPPHIYFSQNMFIFPSVYICPHISIFPTVYLSIFLTSFPSFPQSHLQEREIESQRKIFVGGRPAFQISNKDAISSIPKNHISSSFTPSRHIRERSRVVRKKNLETMSAGCLFHKIED